MELAGPGIFLIASLDAMSSVEWPLALLASGLVCLAVKRPGLRVKGFTEANRWACAGVVRSGGIDIWAQP